MAYQAREIFRQLGELSETVVLIDEVEEFVRKRKGGSTPAEMANRLITTAMLTLLQELRDRERIILLLATNHIEEFDPAIRRPGRFDLVLNVAPPSVAAKRALLQKAFGRPLPTEWRDVLRELRGTVERATYKEWGSVLKWARQDGASADGLREHLTSLDETLIIGEADWDRWQQEPSQVNV